MKEVEKTKNEMLKHVNQLLQKISFREEVSDGYHTFKELYEFREQYNRLFLETCAKAGLYDVHKSKRHGDGEKCFGGTYFIVMAELPTGQISNHYPLELWDSFNIPEKKFANEYDGHDARDVLNRMKKLKI
jgi:hypothetical protein